MNDIPDNFGPWEEPPQVAGYCVFCKEVKTPPEIRHHIGDDDDEEMMTREVLEIGDDIDLPLVFCKKCVDDVWFADDLDEKDEL